MSNTKLLNAKLEGHAGPFFPPASNRLQRRWEPRSFQKSPITYSIICMIPLELGAVGLAVTVEPDPVTTDGTAWLAKITITYPPLDGVGRKYVILIPKAEDKTLLDGTCASAKVALYAEGIDHPPEQERENIMQTLVSAFRFTEGTRRHLHF